MPADILEGWLIHRGLEAIEDPSIIKDWVSEATRYRLAIEDTQTTREGIGEALAKLDPERATTLDQNRKGWIDENETAEALADIEARREDLESQLANLDQKVDVAEIASELATVTIGDASTAPDWASDWEAVVPGTIGPGHDRWEAVKAGLRHEAENAVPAFGGEPASAWQTPPSAEPGELSDWAKTWAAHIVKTLGLTCVVDWNGRFDFFDTDPRDDAELRRRLTSGLAEMSERSPGLSTARG